MGVAVRVVRGEGVCGAVPVVVGCGVWVWREGWVGGFECGSLGVVGGLFRCGRNGLEL